MWSPPIRDFVPYSGIVLYNVLRVPRCQQRCVRGVTKKKEHHLPRVGRSSVNNSGIIIQVQSGHAYNMALLSWINLISHRQVSGVQPGSSWCGVDGSFARVVGVRFNLAEGVKM